ncbi:MAG: hypothetical protein EPN85_10595 [Bacteroidetes bacterium]|nr:MAG: hypothetical protein EPN85_10595 [Bacteroidota bacterium]
MKRLLQVTDYKLQVIAFLLTCNLQPSICNSSFGSRSSGLGNASVSLSDLWSVQNNQSGLGYLKNISAAVYYQNQFLLKELSTKAFAFAAPTKHGTFGVCVSSFGYSLFSQNKYGLAFGKAFGKNISAGMMLDYMETNISEYGKKGSLVAEGGIQAMPMKNLTIGMHLFNLTRIKLADYNDERIPTILRLGADYQFSDKVFVAMETEKDIDKKAMFKAGMEYKPVKELYLRTGISTNPSLSCFGIGVELKHFKLDLSSTYHSTFGFSPQVGLMYEFERSKKKQPAKVTEELQK